MTSNKQAAQKIAAAVAMLEEAESMIDDDPGRKNTKIIHLIRYIGSRVAARLDPESPVAEVYPWQRS